MSESTKPGETWMGGWLEREKAKRPQVRPTTWDVGQIWDFNFVVQSPCPGQGGSGLSGAHRVVRVLNQDMAFVVPADHGPTTQGLGVPTSLRDHKSTTFVGMVEEPKPVNTDARDANHHWVVGDILVACGRAKSVDRLTTDEAFVTCPECIEARAKPKRPTRFAVDQVWALDRVKSFEGFDLSGQFRVRAIADQVGNAWVSRDEERGSHPTYLIDSGLAHGSPPARLRYVGMAVEKKKPETPPPPTTFWVGQVWDWGGYNGYYGTARVAGWRGTDICWRMSTDETVFMVEDFLPVVPRMKFIGMHETKPSTPTVAKPKPVERVYLYGEVMAWLKATGRGDAYAWLERRLKVRKMGATVAIEYDCNEALGVWMGLDVATGETITVWIS